MAEEVLKYKVEIDSSDVAEQLQSIRNQVDLAMGSLAAQQVKPTTFEKVAQTFETANIGGVADAFRQKFEKDTATTMNTMTGMLDKTAERTQLGFSRFTADARRLGLLSPTGLPAIDAPLEPVGPGAGMGFFRGLAASQGLGFDPTMAMTGQDFAAAGAAAVTQGFERFASSAGVTSLGAAIGGLAGGPAGLVGGAMLGGTVDLALGALTSQARDVRDFAGGLAAIGGQNIVGGADAAFFQSQAEGLFGTTRSLAGRTAGLSMDEIGSQIDAFANAGGFVGMDRGDFATTLNQLPSAVRALSQSANLAQPDASALLGNMMSMGLADNVLSASANAMQLANLGTSTGLGIQGVFGAGMMGMNAVSGTGVNPGDAFNMASQITGQFSQGVLAGNPALTAFATSMGGAQQAGFAVFEQGMRNMMSPIGLAATANVMGGGSPSTDMATNMAGAANFFTQDPGNIFSALANQGLVAGQFSPLMVQNMGAQMGVDMLQGMGFTNGQGQVDPNQLAGIMMSLDPSLSPEQARAQVVLAQQGPGPMLTQNLNAAMASNIDINAMNSVSPVRAAIASATQPFISTFDQTIGAVGNSIMDSFSSFKQSSGDFVTEILTGRTIDRRDPVNNVRVQGFVRNLVSGTSLNEDISGDKEFDAGNVEEVVAANEARSFVGDLASSDVERFMAMHGRDDMAGTRFALFSRGRSKEVKHNLMDYMVQNSELGRHPSVNDIKVFAGYQEEYRTALEEDGLESLIQTANNRLDVVTGAAGTGTRQAVGAEIMNMTDKAALDHIAELYGGKSFSDLDSAGKRAVYERFSDMRFSSDETEIVTLDPTLSNAPGVFSQDMADREGRRANDQLLLDNVTASAEFKQNLSKGREKLEGLGDIFTPSQLDKLRAKVGDNKVGMQDLISAVLGEETSLGDLQSLVTSLERDGETGLARAIRSFERTAKPFTSKTFDVGGANLTTQEIQEMSLAYDISTDVLQDLNEFKDILPESYQQNDTVMDQIKEIAINERLSGKDRETVKTNMEDRLNKLNKIHNIKMKGQISQNLENVMTADAIAGADRLSEAVAFNKMFDGMDADLQIAAADNMQLQFFITGNQVNKKMMEAFGDDGKGLLTRTVK